MLRENKVLLVPLPKGVIGPEPAQLLGAIVLAELWVGSGNGPGRRRTPAPGHGLHRRGAGLPGLPTDLGDALATARSPRAGFHLAHQYQKQSPRRCWTPSKTTRVAADLIKQFGESGLYLVQRLAVTLASQAADFVQVAGFRRGRQRDTGGKRLDGVIRIRFT
ncbi:hypothetical protein ACIA5H_37425 [Nocardia sp. NPDC051900]|uniref:hypothetical protein n=1 Tax=Nocardia sp. NPDC051900 TaxID=3364326 RepID=UPI0037951385